MSIVKEDNFLEDSLVSLLFLRNSEFSIKQKLSTLVGSKLQDCLMCILVE